MVITIVLNLVRVKSLSPQHQIFSFKLLNKLYCFSLLLINIFLPNNLYNLMAGNKDLDQLEFQAVDFSRSEANQSQSSLEVRDPIIICEQDREQIPHTNFSRQWCITVKHILQDLWDSTIQRLQQLQPYLTIIQEIINAIKRQKVLSQKFLKLILDSQFNSRKLIQNQQFQCLKRVKQQDIRMSCFYISWVVCERLKDQKFLNNVFYRKIQTEEKKQLFRCYILCKRKTYEKSRTRKHIQKKLKGIQRINFQNAVKSYKRVQMKKWRQNIY